MAMNLETQINEALKDLIHQFVNETAYQKVHLLSQTSQNLCFQMQSNLVNAQHIWGDALNSDLDTVKQLSISVCVKNLETFVEAITAARELFLILPDRLIYYQDRAEKIIKAIQSLSTPDTLPAQ